LEGCRDRGEVSVFLLPIAPTRMNPRPFDRKLDQLLLTPFVVVY